MNARGKTERNRTVVTQRSRRREHTESAHVSLSQPLLKHGWRKTIVNVAPKREALANSRMIVCAPATPRNTLPMELALKNMRTTPPADAQRRLGD